MAQCLTAFLMIGQGWGERITQDDNEAGCGKSETRNPKAEPQPPPIRQKGKTKCPKQRLLCSRSSFLNSIALDLFGFQVSDFGFGSQHPIDLRLISQPGL